MTRAPKSPDWLRTELEQCIALSRRTISCGCKQLIIKAEFGTCVLQIIFDVLRCVTSYELWEVRSKTVLNRMSCVMLPENFSIATHKRVNAPSSATQWAVTATYDSFVTLDHISVVIETEWVELRSCLILGIGWEMYTFAADDITVFPTTPTHK